MRYIPEAQEEDHTTGPKYREAKEVGYTIERPGEEGAKGFKGGQTGDHHGDLKAVIPEHGHHIQISPPVEKEGPGRSENIWITEVLDLQKMSGSNTRNSVLQKEYMYML